MSIALPTKSLVFIGKEESDETAYNTNDIQMYQKLLQTYAQAIKTRDLVGRAIDNLSYDLKENNVIGALTVTPVTDTQIPFQVVLYFYKYYLNIQVRKLILHLP